MAHTPCPTLVETVQKLNAAMAEAGEAQTLGFNRQGRLVIFTPGRRGTEKLVGLGLGALAARFLAPTA